MNLEDVLGGGYVVAADDWMNLMVVWNGSGTFNVYTMATTEIYKNVDSFYILVANAYDAKRVARKYIANKYDDMERFFGEAA